MEEVANDEAGTHLVEGVAGGVAGDDTWRHHTEADGFAIHKGLHTLAVGRQYLLPALVVLAGGHLSFREVDDGIGEGDVALLVEQPSEVVEVEVGEAYGLDVGRRDIHRLHAIQQLATSLGADAGVEENGVGDGVFVIGLSPGDVDIEGRAESRLAGSEEGVEQGVVVRAAEEFDGLLALAVLEADDLHAVALAADGDAVPFLRGLYAVEVVGGLVSTAAGGEAYGGNGHQGHHLQSCFLHDLHYFFLREYCCFTISYEFCTSSRRRLSLAPSDRRPIQWRGFML